MQSLGEKYDCKETDIDDDTTISDRLLGESPSVSAGWSLQKQIEITLAPEQPLPKDAVAWAVL